MGVRKSYDSDTCYTGFGNVFFASVRVFLEHEGFVVLYAVLVAAFVAVSLWKKV